MRFLIISDMFSLESWLIENRSPEIMPAVYQLFHFLGESREHSFKAYMIHPRTNKVITFPNGSQIYIVKSLVPFYYFRKLFSLFYFYRKAIKQLQSENYDVIYGLSIYSLVTACVGKKTNILSVSRLFGSLVFEYMNKKKYLTLYTRYILQYLEIKKPGDVLICTEDGTQFDEALLRINPKKKCHLLFNGVDDHLRNRLLSFEPVQKISSDNKTHMISIGRLSFWKRHDLAIRLLFLLKTKYNWQDLILTILGKGKQFKQLKKLATKLRISDQVEFLNPIPHHDIPLILKKHQVYLSLYDASNLSNSMWEASLAGRLICTRTTGKTSTIYVDSENCISDDDIEIIAEKLHSLQGRDISAITKKARSAVDSLLTNWPDRINREIDIIRNERDSRAAHSKES